MQVLWNEKDRSLVDEILDQLIPANPSRDIPGAGEAGVAQFIAAKMNEDTSVLAAITDVLTHAKRLAGGMSPNSVRQLETDKPEGFAALVRLTYMGYYSRPDIRSLVGMADWPVHPKGYDVLPESPELIDALTAPVRARGPIYRDNTKGRLDEK